MSLAIYSFISSITNSITSKYDISKSPISTSRLWKIHPGVHKTTQKKVAIFIFDKKTFESSYKRERGASKNDIDKVYELLKKEASSITRLRHPSILQVVEPMSESRSSIVFVTEPLINTLSQLMTNDNSYASKGNSNLEFDLDELEIQKGLLQVGKGLQFLSDARVVHLNLTPDAIFVNAKGDWKIGGFGYSETSGAPDSQTAEMTIVNNEYLPDQCQINLDYAAPEYILNYNVTQSNDLFSLGCLAYTVHNKGESLLQTFNNMRSYERKVETLSSMNLSKMPPDLKDVIRRLLARQPTHRMSLKEFQNSGYFDNLLVSTMKFLESFPEKTRDEKIQFMKGLARVLERFPPRVMKRKILPSLLEELKDHKLLPYTVPNIFIIVQHLDKDEFCELALPSLKPIFKVHDPPQNMVVLLDKLDVLQKKTTPETFREDVMPLVYAALETPVVVEKALSIIPSLAEPLDYQTVKNSLFPRVQALFAKTTALSVKVSTLKCFHSMIKVIDKFTMQEKLIPLLNNIKTKEPAVMLAALAVYDAMGEQLDREVIATEILPQLWKMSVGPLLNVDQFQKFMKTIREISTRVEEAHTRHLKEVRSLEEQTRSVSANPTPTPSGNGIANTYGAERETSFEDLVQGKSSVPVSGVNDSDMFGAWADTLKPTGTTLTSSTKNTIPSLSSLSSFSTLSPSNAVKPAPLSSFPASNSRPLNTVTNTIPMIPNASTVQRHSSPLSTTMGTGLLKPISSKQTPPQSGHKTNDLSAFDPYS